MSVKKYIAFLLFLVAPAAKAQYSYSIDQSIPVEANGNVMSLAWAGGLNAAQISTLDLNGDDKDDLVIFERNSNTVITFLNINNAYHYAPEYETLFPSEVDQWLLLRDFNGDGKKDIFTSDPLGMRVFVNTTGKGKTLSWRPYDDGNALRTIGFSPNINLQVNGSDVPIVDDIDGDGDLDIIVARFSFNTGVLEYHQNMNLENSGNLDSLQMKRITQNWGNFEECNCGKFIFDPASTCASGGGRITHAAGKSMLTLDIDNDGDKDLFFSEETCTNIDLMMNEGDNTNAVMKSFNAFPLNAPLSFDVFPAAYYEDVTFDGIPDLVVSSNIYSRTTFATTFNKTMWLYQNTGTKQLPNFAFVKNNFLQDQMFDVGDSAVPAFFDVDGDSDLDLILGTYGNEANTSFYYYQNIGTSNTPSFRFVTKDFLNFSLLNKSLSNFKPQFADMDMDGKTDFVFTATRVNDATTQLYYIQNKNSEGLDVSGQELISINHSIQQNENILVTDVNKDGITDLLIGTATGALEYWINYGPKGSFNYALKNPSFLGLNMSTDRQNVSLALGDLNNDGFEELIVGDQRGQLTIYDNFRAQPSTAQGINQLVKDPLSNQLTAKNLGGRVWPSVANLFLQTKPSIVAGTVLGGLILLKSNDSEELATEPLVKIYPNPISRSGKLTIQVDRNMQLSLSTLLGQQLGTAILLNANEAYEYSVDQLSPGIYIATFAADQKRIIKKFIVY